MRSTPSQRQRGATMIEVLVTLVIIAFGLLGMAGLQARLHMSEIESYQRSQALLLLNDMANRMASNRNNAASYDSATTYGSGMTCPTATSTTAERDLRDWCGALQGAATTQGTSQVGGVIGGRGCIQAIDGEYLITVSWQGTTPISAPPAAVTCGAGQYDSTNCPDDLCRRVLTTLVRIAAL